MRNILIIFLLISTLGYAQDPIFTQYFMIPETLNSSFTGAKKSTRAGIIHRTQWPGLNFSINTQYAFVDNWFEEIDSGLGISILNHKETTTRYNLTQVNINYAYELQLTSEWYFRPSLSFGLGLKDFGFQNLLLEDQINLYEGIINPTSMDQVNLNDSRIFYDIGTSFLLYNEDSWIGLSVLHLNQPNISMTFEGEESLDIFASLHGSYKIPTGYRSKVEVYGLFNAMIQGDYNRMDVGGKVKYNSFYFGALGATNPIKSGFQSHTLTSINGFFGFDWKGFRIAYSYDFNTTNIGRTGGVYELSVFYDFGQGRKCYGCPDY
jgi:type IX secretion system PorP/SprF family membrane protein